jgi:CRISPR-associated protein Csx14
MKQSKVNAQTLIATLGSEPQVVTIVLDQLLARGYAIDQVVVVYTADDVVLQAMARVASEFDGAVYRRVTLRTAPIVDERGAVQDFRGDDDMRALLRTLYREVREQKRNRRAVHLCVSGGRKVMGVMAMVVAQLLFDANDRVWHLMSEGWTPGSEKRMHARSQDQIWLVPVPVLRWTDSAGLLAAFGELDDPEEAMRRQEELARADDLRRAREFVEKKLTRAERDVVVLTCRGLDNAAIARRLHKSQATVANQLTSAYGKLNEFLGFPERAPDRAVLVATVGLYFALRGGGRE